MRDKAAGSRKKPAYRALIAGALFFIAGAGLLLYPAVSNYLASRGHSRVISTYSASAAQLEEAEALAIFKAAQVYNDAAGGKQTDETHIAGSGYTLPDAYESILNIGGVMGYLEIPAISVSLPVYHSVSDEVLRKGVGHLEGSSFPVGSESGHAVLTAHRGLPQAKLFTDLDLLAKGDLFYIHVLNRVLAYEVEHIYVVEPDETDFLRPVQGKDYVTLVTCTPYAVNSHRLLVQGRRTQYNEEVKDAIAKKPVGRGIWWLTFSAGWAGIPTAMYLKKRRRYRK